MVWSDADATTAFEFVRTKATEGSGLLLTAARAVLQHGTIDEAGLRCLLKIL